MLERVSRYLSLDDLWSVLGYFFFLGISRMGSSSLELSAVSVLASGMLAILWLAGADLRKRNLERHPNARVVVWASVAVVSILIAIR